MVTFWQVTNRPSEGFAFLLFLASGATPSCHLVRVLGSDFLSLGLLVATSVYAVIGRLSMCATTLKRSVISARIIGRSASMFTGTMPRVGVRSPIATPAGALARIS